MIPPPPIRPGREKLRFRLSAESAFRFLEEMGFRVTRAEVTLVRYESDAVFVNVYHGRASYEIGLEVGLTQRRPADPEPWGRWQGYDIYHLLSPAQREGYPTHGWAASGDPALVETFVKELAGQLRTVPEEVLRGSPTAWAAIDARRLAASRAAGRARAAEDARAAADRARMAGDWAAVVRAYEPISADLTPVERHRLEYARKMVRRGK